MSGMDLLDIVKANAPSLMPTFGYALVWVLVRFIFYTAMRAYWKTLPAGKKLKDVGLQEKVLEEAYAILGSLVGFILGLQALKHSDRGGCGMRSTWECCAGWPDAVGPRDASIALYHNVELGWYLHYLVKHSLGIGMEDNLQMHLHHAATVTLLLISFTANFFRMGVLVLCVLNVSNPFLHAAKVLHNADLPGDQIAFLLFAAAFFLSRIVVFPAVVLRATMWEARLVNPRFTIPGLDMGVYLAANVLLGALMLLQVIWFKGIVRVVTKALSGSKDDFKQETRVHDYVVKKQE